MQIKRRSSCPVAYSLDFFGDRWSLLILRNMVFEGYRYFREFLNAGEGIATNVLSNRLERLEDLCLIESKPDPDDGRRKIYHLTEAGLDVIPILVELVVWGASHDPESSVGEDFLKRAREDREGMIRGYRERARRNAGLQDPTTR